MALAGSKSVFQSLTLRGVVIAAIPTVMKLLGVDLGAEGADVVTEFVDAAITLVGLGMAIRGRYRATQTLTL